MANLAVSERRAVLDLGRADFDEVCGELMRIVSHEQRPDALIAIPSGGLFVAEAMTKAAEDVPILSLTCRRPSSKLKAGSSTVRRMVSSLPRPIVDTLRVAEHAILTRRPATPPTEPYRFIEQELDDFRRWVAGARKPPYLLIVDDAIDSGATLSQVAEAVRRLAPPGAKIRSAVITVTTDWPLIRPDYSLFHRQLCRFPWSMDAR